MNSLSSNIRGLLQIGQIDAAADQLEELSFAAIGDVVLPLAFQDDRLPYHALAQRLIERRPDAEAHYFAAELLSTALCHQPGAYRLALQHARQAADLAPDNVSYQAFLLLFHRIPEPLIDRTEAETIAARVLAVDSTHLEAQRIRRDMGGHGHNS